MTFTTISILILVLVVIAFTKSICQVPQGSKWVVTRFGKFDRTLEPGLSMIIPFICTVHEKVNTKEIVHDIPKQSVISKDNVSVDVDAVCYFKVVNPEDSAFKVNDLESAITNLVLTNIRSELGKMELDEMLSERDKINNALLKVIDEATNPWGVKVNRVEIKEISPPKDIQEAMESQMKAEREKRAAILQAEGKREAAIKEAEGAKQAQVLRAEGEKEAAFRNAEAREREAEAEAKATTDVSKAIKDGGKDAVNYFIAQKYVQSLEKIGASDNSKVIMLPIEATSITGAIAGVTELLGKDGAPAISAKN